MDSIEQAVREAGRKSALRLIEAGARSIARPGQRHKILIQMWGRGIPASGDRTWPPRQPLTELLLECHERLSLASSARLDTTQAINLAQAEQALLSIITSKEERL